MNSFQKLAEFNVLVSYYTISVVDPSLKRPFNDWQPEHIKQGFTWRFGSVSFATLDIIDMYVEVEFSGVLKLRPEAQRIIRVPFEVASARAVRIATMSNSEIVSVATGSYGLVYQHWLSKERGAITSNEKLRCVFTFVPEKNPTAEVILADPGLAPSDPLVMVAEPA